VSEDWCAEERQVDRLTDILQRTPVTPEEQARKAARQALRDAEKAHAATVKAARKELARAEKARARAVKEAEAGVRDAERSGEDEIRAAERALSEAGVGRELARYRDLILYDDQIRAPEGPATLTRSVRALVDAASNLVQREVAMSRSGSERPSLLAALQSRARRSRDEPILLLETREFASIAPCGRDEAAAREFARRVNVAVLNAVGIVRDRSDAVAAAERELEELRARRAAAVARAEWKLSEVEEDTRDVEEARAALAAAEADVAEVEARRTALAALEQPQSA
jgi:hypothetical protein